MPVWFLSLLIAASALAQEAPSVTPAAELVESFPVETSLNNPDLPEAHVVWGEMIAGAKKFFILLLFWILQIFLNNKKQHKFLFIFIFD